MSYIRDLVAEARAGDPVAIEEVFDFLDHVLDQPGLSVAVAFGLQDKQRPAEPTPIWIRDAIIEEYAETLGNLPSVRAQAQAVLAAARRPPAPVPEGTKHESLLANRLYEIGVGELSERTVRRILGAR